MDDTQQVALRKTRRVKTEVRVECEGNITTDDMEFAITRAEAAGSDQGAVIFTNVIGGNGLIVISWKYEL